MKTNKKSNQNRNIQYIFIFIYSQRRAVPTIYLEQNKQNLLRNIKKYTSLLKLKGLLSISNVRIFKVWSWHSKIQRATPHSKSDAKTCPGRKSLVPGNITKQNLPFK